MQVLFLLLVVATIIALYRVLRSKRLRGTPYLDAKTARGVLRKVLWQKSKVKKSEAQEREQEEFNIVLQAIKQALDAGQTYLVLEELSETTSRRLHMAGYSVDSLTKIVSWV
jgi:hypothetical protein